ncbi:MAG: MBOAT family protein, partial [Bacteroidales bacterium]|nr:MBOAT family protein [Bacteroidales bacterium]
MLVYAFIHDSIKIRSLYLFVVSLFFYYKSSGFFFLLLVVNIIINYFLGNGIYKAKKQRSKKIYLIISVFVNLFILSYFKYTFFFVNAVNTMFGTDFVAYNYLAEFSNLLTGTHFDTMKIFLPVGISFFTFQTLSYTIDLYRGHVQPVKNIIDFGFFVSFFPQLVAGPIVRASEFIPQIYKKYSLTRYEFGMALFMILKGLVKKIVIGDYIAVNFIDRIYANPEMYTGFESLMSMIAYSLQVYVDFSGYTDIAIGVALLMGFRLSPNFNSPYKAKNCSEFWGRWHISLSTWLKDYLYIPLGGNRTATKGTYINFALILL